METIIKPSIKSTLILAPMVRICTLPFRQLCFNHGADIIYTEEIIAKKLITCSRIFNTDLQCYDYISLKDNSLVLRILPSEKGHLILQLGVSSAEDAVKAAKIAQEDISGIDLNMGCPKHFSTHGNMGSALLSSPLLAKEILEALVLNFPSKSISCKIRLLPNEDKLKELIEIVESSKIDYFAIHLRYKEETCKDKAKWKEVYKVKEYATIPFAVNGDLFTPRDIQVMAKTKTCDGFMLGRGAIHNPNVYNEYKESDEDLEVTEFNKEEALIDNDVHVIPSETTEKDASEKKQKGNDDSNDIAISAKLSKALEKKYNNKQIDILPIIEEFFELCLRYGNLFGNTKYIILYIMKTHRHMIDLFTKIQNCRNYESLAQLLHKEDLYQHHLTSNPNMKSYYDNSFYRNYNTTNTITNTLTNANK